MKKVALKVDEAFLEKESYLEEKDFNSVNRSILGVINPLRADSVRKFLNFTPIPYTTYVSEFGMNAPTPEGELDLALLSIPLFFETSFHPSFFPSFENEFIDFHQFDPSTRTMFCDMVMIPNADYHSLTIAGHEIEQAIKEGYKKSLCYKDISNEMEVVVNFLIDTEQPMQLIKVLVGINVFLS